jgi:hypothetical protein
MRVTVRPFVDADAGEIAVQPVQLVGMTRASAADAVRALASPGRAFTMRDPATGRILCIAGLAEQAPHYATGWASIAEGKGSALVAITRIVRRYLARENFLRTDCLIHADDPSARKWAGLLGFTAEARLTAAAPDGGDMIVYFRMGAG